MRGLAAFRAAIAPGGILAGPWVKNELWRRARAVPSLDLRFAENKSLVDATTGANLVTFTRASGGTYVDSQGVIRNATTNLLLQSEDISTSWTKDANSVITTNAAVAPNGAATADKFAVGTSTFPQLAQTVASTLSLTHAFSVYVKAAGTGFLQLRIRNQAAASNYFRAVFNLSTGAVTLPAGFGNGSISSATAVSVGDGWWRCSIVGSPDTSGTSAQPLAILTTDASGTVATSSNSNATDGVLLWAAQLEQSSTVGEYIPTTSTINSAPRFDHNPTTGESLGLLVEEQRTNLLLRSDFSAGWLFTNASFTGTTTAPDGTNAGQLLNDSNSGAAGYAYQGVSVTNGQAYSLSCFVKASGKTTILFQNFTQAGAVTFTLTGSGSTGSASGAFSSASINAFGNGWYRCTVVYTASSTQTVNIGFSTNDGPFTGDAFYLWGAQLEAGAFPTSYIPTTTAAATRSADVASITGTNFSSWYWQDEGTIAYEGACGSFASFPILVHLHDGTSNNYITSVMTSGGAGRIAAVVGGVAWSNASTSNTVAINSNFRQTSSYSSGAQSVCLNAAAIATASNASMPSVNQIRIGDWRNAGQCINGTIRRIAYWPQRLSNSTLQRITQ